MYHNVTYYGAFWATSKKNNVINLVKGTVSQNILPGVVRISFVVEPIFRRYMYHQTIILRSDFVHSSYKSLNRCPCRSVFSWGGGGGRGGQNTYGARSIEYGACCILAYLFYSGLFFHEPLVSSVFLTVLFTCCSS